MNVLHQQRVRVLFNPASSFAPAKPWEMLCPCCEDRGLVTAFGCFGSWGEAMAWALTHIKLQHCLFCVERQMPAGTDDVLGELFERCPVCTPACVDCDGFAVYPANYNTVTELVNDLAAVRLTPILCDGCYGVVAIVPLDPEVHA